MYNTALNFYYAFGHTFFQYTHKYYNTQKYFNAKLKQFYQYLLIPTFYLINEVS